MFLKVNFKKCPIEFNPYRGRYNLQIDTPGFTLGYQYLSPMGFNNTLKKDLALKRK